MPTDILQTMAECAITFAGFSTLLIVIVQIRGETSDLTFTGGLWLVVLWSLGAFLFALLPLILSVAGFSDEASLRMSAAGFIAYVATVGTLVLLRDRRLEREGAARPPWQFSLAGAVLAIPIYTASGLVALGFIVERAAAFYLGLVMSLFVLAAIPLVWGLTQLAKREG